MKSRPKARPPSSAGGRKAGPAWSHLDDEALLDLRFSDLGLKIEGTELEPRIERLYAELDARHIALHPHCWLSEEWFSPDGVPGIALPFYLAHPRLMQLEDHIMLDVEGGSDESCMRILRHEAGHALDTAFRLHRRRDWQRVFGKASKPYPDYYQPRPQSRRYVLHLNSWYAQAHPSEDFAETFAVWLAADSDWHREYAGWAAKRKLEYVDALMTGIAGGKPAVRARRRVEPLAEIRKTLRAHYEEKHARFIAGHAGSIDRGLRRLFSPSPGRITQETAAEFLRRTREELRRVVADMSGEHEYTVDQVLQDLILRCRQLRLYRHQPQRKSEEEAAALLALHTRNYLENGQHRFAL
ncbi:MAG TPA: putative zinc-binding metallopeptidase [Pirellulales bacterium]|nr:putative zinc-binding metallopeptidase [Pirellulales bacterium]